MKRPRKVREQSCGRKIHGSRTKKGVVVGAKITDEWLGEVLQTPRPPMCCGEDEWMEREGEKRVLRIGSETDSSGR